MNQSLETRGASDAPLELCVVAHTHWDREWYHSAARFRQRLVALVDALLARSAGESFPFLLDGQTVVLEDYLAVRPEMDVELRARLQNGDLEAGPWYVLADGLIPSGEAIVRNLMVGRRMLRRFGAAAPPVAYCPDTFGHAAAIPTIARGFGFELAIVWRGYGGARWPSGDVAHWCGADGNAVLLYHLPPDGYETGSALPTKHPEVVMRWRALLNVLQNRASTGVVLLPTGADHHALQPNIAEAIQALETVARPHSVQRTSLSTFASRLIAAAARADLPVVDGELRDSYGYTWTLGGTFGTRAHQKRANAKAERLLVRDVEPWMVLAWLHGSTRADIVSNAASLTLVQMPALLDAAWRTLLRAHPHDTLCGCSIDTVARAMDGRLESAVAQAKGLRAAALHVALQHDDVAARAGALAPVPTLVVRNRCARWRGGLAEVVLDETVCDVPVGPSSVAVENETTRPVSTPVVGAFPLQLLGTRVVYRCRESSQHYPDNDAVRAHRALVWVPAVPPVGVALHALQSVSSMSESTIGVTQHESIQHPAIVRVRGDNVELSNGRLTVVASRNGIGLTLGARTLSNAMNFESTSDIGDAYTPALRGKPELLRIHSVIPDAQGPLRASLIVEFRTARKHHGVRVRATIVLDAHSDVVRVDIQCNNQRRNHRLRVNFNADVHTFHSTVDVWADAAFGPVERRELNVPAHDQAREMVPATMPMHRWAAMTNGEMGATLHADGLAEVEANRTTGALSLTLLRAIAELSRNDLPERPGHAGWPAAIPLAQSQGVFHARIGLQLHGGWSQETRDAIEDANDSLLVPLTGETMRDFAGSLGGLSGPLLSGTALRLSTIALADDGDGIVMRCVNDSAVAQHGTWTLPENDELEFVTSRLDETPEGEWQHAGNQYAFVALPREVVTVRARRRSS